MKYIKNFESVAKFIPNRSKIVYSEEELTPFEKEYINKYYKFKLGDYVRFIPDFTDPSLVYKVHGIDVTNNWRNERIYSLFSLLDKFLGWYKEDYLVAVPEEEICAIKYNL